MTKTKLKIIAILITVLCVSFFFYIYKFVYNQPEKVPERGFATPEVLTAKITANVLKSNNENYIILYIAPATDPVFVSAFGLNLKITLDEDVTLTDDKAVTNKKLTEDKWTYFINQVTASGKDIFFQLSASHLGETYKLNKEIEIARIPVEKLESTNTKLYINNADESVLYGSDAVKNIPIIVE